MAKYRKKPVVIEAIQWQGNFDEIEKFVGGDAESRNGELIIATLEGPLHASHNDWIIKGVKGEFYPCKPDIFKATYDIVEDKTARWEDAIANAKFMLEEYKKIPSGGFGAITITQTIIRYENGERTDELLEELEGIQ